MIEERLKLAVFIDFDNIQIGVKETLGKEFDVSVVLEALKERGEVVTKIAYGDWPRAGDQSRQMTLHAVQMVQRNLTPRGDKNGADINLALDALEMAFTRHHINAFAIVGGDSDFITLVEKLKQYDKRVFVVGGRQFTSGILQRNCHEFIAYENLLKSATGGDGGRAARSSRAQARAASDSRLLTAAMPNVARALKIMAEREVAPQVGLLKSTILQLDPTFSERDYGAGSFLEFMQKMERAGLVHLRKTDRGFLAEPVERGEARSAATPVLEAGSEPVVAEPAEAFAESAPARTPEDIASRAEAMGFLRQAVTAATEKAPNRPLYLRQIRQGLRSADQNFDERRYDFRAIVDLLHQAQREGWLRLHRDRKGVWRIFSVAAAVETPLIRGLEPATEAAASAGEAAPAAASVTWEETRPVLGESAGQAAAPAEAAPRQAPAERKARKPRAKAPGRSGSRKAASRRRPKEPAPSDA